MSVLSQPAILHSEQLVVICSQCWETILQRSHVSACLTSEAPFVPDHLFKDVCIMKSLGRQS